MSDRVLAALQEVVAELPGGATRSGQEAMARAVSDAIVSSRHLVVQAGTGTGKTLAYLVPAVLSGRRTVVATATKALQDQLCVAPSTRILTADLHHVPASSVFVGQELLGFDEERDGTRRRYRRSVVEAVETIRRPCYELEFDDGTQVTCSAEHRWLVAKTMEVKWLTTERMVATTGGRLGSNVIRLADVWEEDRSWEAGYLAGMYDGEGCLQQRMTDNAAGRYHFNSLSFSQVDNEALKQALVILDGYGIDYAVTRRKKAQPHHQETFIVRTSQRSDIVRVLGQFRPGRLLAKFDPDGLGTIPGRKGGQVNGQRLVRKTFVGEQEVLAIRTSTRTYIAEGLASHNCSKDLPFLSEHLDRPFSYAVLKGRSNYLCRQRLDEALDGEVQLSLGSGFDPADGPSRGELDEIVEWAEQTLTGDRADLEHEPRAATWSAVSTGSDECPGAAKCPRGEDCFAEDARQAAAAADVVVVNTHLYGTNLAAGGAVLPEHDLVIFDEAHQLEDTVSETCGAELSGGRFTALAHVVGGIIDDDELRESLLTVGDRVGLALAPDVGSRLRRGVSDDLRSVLEAARSRLAEATAALKGITSDAADVKTRKERALKAVMGLESDIDRALDLGPEVVAWIEQPGREPRLCIAPLDVAPILDALVWEPRTAILTSATIPPGLSDTIGLPAEDVDELDAGSPFDFGTQGLVYCAAHLPDPRNNGYEEALHDELLSLITAAGGRTLALFTSYRAMQAAADALRDELETPVLVQGDLPKPALTRAFADDEPTSLFATLSYWQGVDVPGRSLSLVTIDKLPFPRPDEPLLQARREQARQGAFATVDLPRATTLLAQGVGRLIRTSSDRGVVAVLDSRLAKASYRWTIVNALPPMKRTRHRAEAEAFLKELTQD